MEPDNKLVTEQAHLAAQFGKSPEIRAKMDRERELAILGDYGAHYFQPPRDDLDAVHWCCPPRDSYVYAVHTGPQVVTVAPGDSVWWLGYQARVPEGDSRWSPSHGDLRTALAMGTGWAHVAVGPARVQSYLMAVMIRGYRPAEQSVSLRTRGTVLPYVNGCSTREVIPPARLGDPTLQHLLIPAGSKEQAHHIHSTARVVYVLRGRGFSVVGMEGRSVRSELVEGMVAVLDPMCPHHFETEDSALEVLPVHIWSSVPGEINHPMMRGTHLTDQGR